jgi:hypothetical protein
MIRYVPKLTIQKPKSTRNNPQIYLNQPEIDLKTNSRQLQIPQNTADNPLHSTDAGSKMLRARCQQGIQAKTLYINTMQIACLSFKTLQTLSK